MERLETRRDMPILATAATGEKRLTRIETRAILKQLAGSRNPARLMSGRKLNPDEAARHAVEVLRDVWFVAQAAGNNHLAGLTECAFYEAYVAAGGNLAKAQTMAIDIYRARSAVA